jgi:hypothetical protein
LYQFSEIDCFTQEETVNLKTENTKNGKQGYPTMLDSQSFSDCTSHNLEKIVLERFRHLAVCLPQQCRIFREPWGCSTVICIDCQDCPEKLSQIKNQADLLAIAADELGLGHSVTFKIGNQVVGWTDLTTPPN